MAGLFRLAGFRVCRWVFMTLGAGGMGGRSSGKGGEAMGSSRRGSWQAQKANHLRRLRAHARTRR